MRAAIPPKDMDVARSFRIAAAPRVDDLPKLTHRPINFKNKYNARRLLVDVVF
jgi:hypothetical protein